MMQPRNKLLAAAGVIGLLVCIVLLLRRDGQLDQDRAPDDDGALPTVTLGSAPAPEVHVATNAAAVEALGSRARVAAVDAGSGSLRIHVMWHDNTSATGVGIMLYELENVTPAETFPCVTSDDAGDVRFQYLAPGRISIESERGGSLECRVTAGMETAAELVIPEGTLVTGVVVDEHQSPVVGAAIWLSNYGTWLEGALVTSSGVDGRFELRDVTGRRHVGARAPGLIVSPLYTIGAGLRTRQVAIEMRHGGATLSGTVHDVMNQPIAGAAIVATRSEEGWDVLSPDEDKGPSRGPPPLRCESDDEGRFFIEGVPEGNLTVYARHEGYGISVAELGMMAGDRRDLDILMEPGCVARGSIRAMDGTPVSGANISCGAFGSLTSHRTQSIGDGSFELKDLSPGRATLVAYHRTVGQCEKVEQLSTEGPVDVEFVLDPGRELSGRVMDSNDAPLIGAVVRLKGVWDESHPIWRMAASTDRAGAFAFTNIAPGPLVCEVYYRLEDVFPVVCTELASAAESPLVLRVAQDDLAGGSISGRIYLVEGWPKATSVELMHVASGKIESRQVSSPGPFVIEHVPAGLFDITIRADGTVPRVISGVKVSGTLNVDVGDVSLEAGCQVRVRLVPEGGVVPGDLPVLLRKEGGDDLLCRAVGEEALFCGVGEGVYCVLVLGNGLAVRPRWFDVDARTNVDVDIAVGKARQVRFILALDAVLNMSDGDAVRVDLMVEGRKIETRRFVNRGGGVFESTTELLPGEYELALSDVTSGSVQIVVHAGDGVEDLFGVLP